MLLNYNSTIVNLYINSLFIARNLHKKSRIIRRLSGYRLCLPSLKSKLNLIYKIRRILRNSTQSGHIVFNSKNRHLHSILKHISLKKENSPLKHLVNRLIKMRNHRWKSPKKTLTLMIRRKKNRLIRRMRKRMKKRLRMRRLRVRKSIRRFRIKRWRRFLRYKYKRRVMRFKRKRLKIYNKIYFRKGRCKQLFRSACSRYTRNAKINNPFEFSYLRNIGNGKLTKNRVQRVLNYPVAHLLGKNICDSSVMSTPLSIVDDEQSTRTNYGILPFNQLNALSKYKHRTSKAASSAKKYIYKYANIHPNPGISNHVSTSNLPYVLRYYARRISANVHPKPYSNKFCAIIKKGYVASQHSYLRSLCHTTKQLSRSAYIIANNICCFLMYKHSNHFMFNIVRYISNECTASYNSYTSSYLPLFSNLLSFILKKYKPRYNYKRKYVNVASMYNMLSPNRHNIYINPILLHYNTDNICNLMGDKLKGNRVYVYMNVIRTNVFTTLVRNGRIVFSLWSGLLNYKKRLKIQKDVAYKMGGIFYKKMAFYLRGAVRAKIYLVFNGALRFNKFFANTYANVLSKYVHRYNNKIKRRAYRELLISKEALTRRMRLSRIRAEKCRSLYKSASLIKYKYMHKKDVNAHILLFFSKLRDILNSSSSLFGSHKSLHLAVLRMNKYVINMINTISRYGRDIGALLAKRNACFFTKLQLQQIQYWFKTLSIYISDEEMILLSRMNNVIHLLRFVKYLLSTSFNNTDTILSSLKCILAYLLAYFALNTRVVNRALLARTKKRLIKPSLRFFF